MGARNLDPPQAEGGESVSDEKRQTVGQYLRQEREGQNISLADVARVTRITLGSLEALEQDAFHTFPAPFFARGFLRTYATHLGLDPGKVLGMFEAQAETPLPSNQGKKAGPPLPSFRLRPLIHYLIILLVIVVGVGVAYVYIQQPPPPQPSLSAEKPKSPGVEASAPRPAEKLPAPSSSSILEGEKQVLRFKATEITWIRFKLDDQPEFDVLLQPGESITRTALRQIKLTIGNAGGVETHLNERPLGPLGEPGQVVHLLFPDDLKKIGARDKKAP